MSNALRLLRAMRDDRGVALVEFACVLPVLLLMFLASYQLTDALSCNRKVTITARAIADLTTQNANVTQDQVDAILGASSKIMIPYSVSNAVVRVSELYTDASGKNTTVVWSRDNRAGGRTVNSAYTTIPTAIQQANTYIIVSEVFYSYKPPATFGMVGNLTLSDTIYMNPRVSNSVDWKSS